MKKNAIKSKTTAWDCGQSKRAQVNFMRNLRAFRKAHPEFTIILPEEKNELRTLDEVHLFIPEWVICINDTIEKGKLPDNAYYRFNKTNQIIMILKNYYRFSHDCITEEELYRIVEKIIADHKEEKH